MKKFAMGRLIQALVYTGFLVELGGPLGGKYIIIYGAERDPGRAQSPMACAIDGDAADRDDALHVITMSSNVECQTSSL